MSETKEKLPSHAILNHRHGVFILMGLGMLLFTYYLIGGGIGVLLTSIRRLLNLPSMQERILQILTRGILSLINILIFAILIRRILKRSLSELGFGLHPKWWQELLFGISITTMALVVVFGIELWLNWLTIHYWVWERESLINWLLIIAKSLVINGSVAIAEELVFRGYLLTGLKEAWGDRVGLGLMALIFSTIHLLAPGADLLPWPLLILALMPLSLLFGYAYLKTGSLWLPIGIHFAWNLVELDLLNLTGYSELPELFGAMTSKNGPNWLLGTIFDVSTGLISIIPITIIFLGIWYWLSRNPDLQIDE